MQINSIGIGMNGIGTESASSANRKINPNRPRLPEGETALSTGKATVEALVTRAMQAEPTRAAKVQALQTAVEQGTYSVEPRAIAVAMTKELAG
jgi:anti-sigma28 factor (negative regulator of flagellin synthesis)